MDIRCLFLWLVHVLLACYSRSSYNCVEVIICRQPPIINCYFMYRGQHLKLKQVFSQNSFLVIKSKFPPLYRLFVSLTSCLKLIFELSNKFWSSLISSYYSSNISRLVRWDLKELSNFPEQKTIFQSLCCEKSQFRCWFCCCLYLSWAGLALPSPA